MKLILATNEGVVVEQWIIEVEFGDIDKPLPLRTLADEVRTAWRRGKKQEEGVQDG